jgi:ribosomal protein S6--L-glutamate ligase
VAATSWLTTVDRLRVAFGLDIFGFDVIDALDGPVVVDVNPFPGARGVTGAIEAFVSLARARLAAVG